ncbi:hypothetical protein C8J57DRAFT_1248454 [Mycena rebaudengoi]|nr:hypothetical protein C8J57DRAFT_1248454 [Mycena rebaudengoi]
MGSSRPASTLVKSQCNFDYGGLPPHAELPEYTAGWPTQELIFSSLTACLRLPMTRNWVLKPHRLVLRSRAGVVLRRGAYSRSLRRHALHPRTPSCIHAASYRPRAQATEGGELGTGLPTREGEWPHQVRCARCALLFEEHGSGGTSRHPTHAYPQAAAARAAPHWARATPRVLPRLGYSWLSSAFDGSEAITSKAEPSRLKTAGFNGFG